MSCPPQETSGLVEVAVPVATMWTGSGAPRDVDAPAVRDVPDVAAWAGGMDAGVRKGLDGRTLTQLLLGEPARIVEESGDWARVLAPYQRSPRHPDGYPGWVRRAHLATHVDPTSGRTAYVHVPTTTLRVVGGPDLSVSFGTVLWVDDVTVGHAEVLLPGGRAGLLPLSDLRLSTKEEPPTCDVESVLADASRFLGLRYLWGGLSAWGLDCSGLVHLVCRARGVLVPRDAKDQAAELEPVRLDEVRRGDLYFFARPGEHVYHVGFATAPPEGEHRMMLHAPESGELIEDAPMAPYRLEHLVSAGRLPGP